MPTFTSLSPGAILLIGLAVILVVFMLTRKCGRRDGYDGAMDPSYRYLGSVYNPEEGGSRAEKQDDCLQFPGYRHCMLTDGTFGTCNLNGMCVASMLVDLRKEDRCRRFHLL